MALAFVPALRRPILGDLDRLPGGGLCEAVNFWLQPLVLMHTMLAQRVISTYRTRGLGLSIEREGETAGRAWFQTVDDGELDRAYRLAGFLLGNAPEAEDAAQDALTRAWMRRGTLRSLDSAQAWFDRILVNICRDRLRRRRTIRWVSIARDESSPVTDPFGAALARDEILAGLAVLDADHRIVVVLRFWADLPLEAIAERLSLPIGTVKSRLHYGLRDLRRAMEPEDPGR